MTKLEQKLIELGYEFIYYDEHTCEKEYVKLVEGATLSIYYICYLKTCHGICEANSKLITQKKIDILQQAFNQLQNDLKELKEYE